ncbi:Gfo/Idh/MocA family oxidoreductase [Oscillochloris sp. ZM17-4]|uniref:Gfo/Idh/MocA family protein n=1 Tax=Oscillochloris sp. ZM17-4 TaxID=2866714 RepID=UPI001C73C199|nr:Gfo/Idh/MocA family oxidoreductase [Oscillochloris sp. ZM17-4]MBX0329583.1 Gfo/Idh/MocA family oxidoreductase [Oscillochloris sp. ZM17-4]
MSKVRWGILSTANIGMKKVTPAMMRGELCEVTAIASRSQESARAAADELGIPKAYGSYEELLADPEVDAIYNPLPNHLHVPWSVKAIEAGKHVLCEKPIGLSAAEAQQLIDVAARHPQVKVMEAFMYRHHPQWQRARAIVRAGGVGQLLTIQSFFSYYNRDPANVRNMADIGGGGLMDIGCYNISLSRFIFEGEPRRACGLIDYDPDFGTDRIASGMLDFAAGSATFTCSTQMAGYQRAQIFGGEGRIEIEIPFNAPPDVPTRLWHQRGGQLEEIVFPACDQYTIQGDLMSRAILDDAPVPTPLSDALANMRVIEALVASGKSGGWVSLSPNP